MRKTFKKVLAFALAAVLTLGTVSTATAATPSPTTGKNPVDQKAPTDSKLYTAKTYKTGRARIIGAKTVKRNMTIPNKVKVNGVKYRVTSIGAKSLKNWGAVKKITLSKNIKTVHKNSFKNCKSLKTLVVKNTKDIWFSPKTFKGVNTKKMTIKFSKKMSKKTYAKMQKQLKKAGFKGKVTRA